MKIEIRNLGDIKLSKQEAKPKRIVKEFTDVNTLIDYLNYYKVVKHSKFKIEIEK
jgi:hypothetical protein